MPYCQPWQAGIASSTQGVCRRIGRVLDALDSELSSNVVKGPERHAGQQEPIGQAENGILDDVRAFRGLLVQRLEAEGWSFSYDGGNRMKVRAPGHKRPFAKVYANGNRYAKAAR